MKSIRSPQDGSGTSSPNASSLTGTSTQDPSSMSPPNSSPALPNAISSQGWASGPTPSRKPTGPSIVKSGQEAALASHFPEPEVSKVSMTSGTSGPRGSSSSASAHLQR